MMHAIIVFTLAVRVCGPINEGCHWAPVADYTAEPVCHAAGAVMQIYPRVFGYKCAITVREQHLHVGNFHNQVNPF